MKSASPEYIPRGRGSKEDTSHFTLTSTLIQYTITTLYCNTYLHHNIINIFRNAGRTQTHKIHTSQGNTVHNGESRTNNT